MLEMQQTLEQINGAMMLLQNANKDPDTQAL
jgi:hypothetical protein